MACQIKVLEPYKTRMGAEAVYSEAAFIVFLQQKNLLTKDSVLNKNIQQFLTPVNYTQLENFFNNNERFYAFSGDNILFTSIENQENIRRMKLQRDVLLSQLASESQDLTNVRVVKKTYSNTGKSLYGIGDSKQVLINNNFEGYELVVGDTLLATEEGWNHLLITPKLANLLKAKTEIELHRVGANYSLMGLYKALKATGSQMELLKVLKNEGYYFTDNADDSAKDVDFLEARLQRLENLDNPTGKKPVRIYNHFGSSEMNPAKAGNRVTITKTDAAQVGYQPYTYIQNGVKYETEVFVLIQGFDIEEQNLLGKDKARQYKDNIDKLSIHTSVSFDRQTTINIAEDIKTKLKQKIDDDGKYLSQLSAGFIKVFTDSDGNIFTVNSDFKPISSEEFTDMVPYIRQAIDAKIDIPFYVTFKHNGEQYRSFAKVIDDGTKKFIRVVIQRSEASQGQESAVVNFRDKYYLDNMIGVNELLSVNDDKLEAKWKKSVADVLNKDGKYKDSENEMAAERAWKAIPITPKDIVFATREPLEPKTYQDIADNRLLEIPTYSTDGKVKIPFVFARDYVTFVDQVLPMPVIYNTATDLNQADAPKETSESKPVEISTFNLQTLLAEKAGNIVKLLRNKKDIDDADLVLNLSKLTEMEDWLKTKEINIDGTVYPLSEAVELLNNKAISDDDITTPLEAVTKVISKNKPEFKKLFTHKQDTNSLKDELGNCGIQTS